METVATTDDNFKFRPIGILYKDGSDGGCGKSITFVMMGGEPSGKILVVSESPFSLANGFGVTLLTFFKGWPAADLAQLYPASLYSRVEAMGGVCVRSGVLDGLESGGRKRWLQSLLGRAPGYLGRFSAPWLRRTLGGWRPELVFVMAYSWPTLRYAAWAAGQLGCPYVVHITDDTLENAPQDQLLAVLQKARRCLGISAKMRDAYARRYHLDFAVLHNGADDALFLPPQTPAPLSGPLVIRYLGALHPASYAETNYHAIRQVAEAVKQANAAGGCVRLEIYGGGDMTRTVAAELVAEGQVVYGGAVDQQTGFELLKTAGLLVIPLAFEGAGAERSRLGFSTKLPEYLASGTPTLVYAPATCALSEYCRAHGVGLTLTTPSVPLLLDLFNDLSQNRARYRAEAAQSQAWAKTHLSAESLRNQFRHLMALALAR